ncbi:MAG: 2-C-methyl-D-erythritol 4-phosphate cytidylyltransferase [Roseburia sp.]|nr:2-C-methyl-D-erythritol 4-phosphate cytidylyltransferase [Roseburia sp.]
MKFKTDSATTNAATVAAVIVCAGKGERTGLNYNKVLHYIGKKTVLETVLDAFSQTSVTQTVVVASAEDEARIREIATQYKGACVCIGGATRAQSVLNGLKALEPCDIVVIHDGARPFVEPRLIDACIESAVEYGSGIAAVRAVDTIKQVSHDRVRTLPRFELFNAQTPQAFAYDKILHAYSCALAGTTDDCEVYENAGYSPRLVDGSYSNIKITTPSDLFRTLPQGARVGIGFDVHRLVGGRPLILGGVTIAHDKGLEGHSDADVLTHAVMDALLSAAGLPDIGVLFPDTDPDTLGISSMKLLDTVIGRVRDAGFSIGNISAVIIAQEPKLAPYIEDIRRSLAARLATGANVVNVSATTTEHLGIVGDGKAIAASASCLLTERYD